MLRDRLPKAPSRPSTRFAAQTAWTAYSCFPGKGPLSWSGLRNSELEPAEGFGNGSRTGGSKPVLAPRPDLVQRPPHAWTHRTKICHLRSWRRSMAAVPNTKHYRTQENALIQRPPRLRYRVQENGRRKP